MTPEHKIRCIIFDMDGTLTRTNQLIYDSFNHVAEKYINKRLAPTEIVALFGPPEKEAVENMIGSSHIDDAMKEYYSFYREKHNELASLYPGIKQLLEFVKKRGLLVCLFTGKGSRTTQISLEKFGIGQYFDMVVTGDDVEHFKPSGDGINRIMKRFSLRPEEVLMVGDSVADIKASRESGVRVAAVVWDSYSKENVIQTATDHLFHTVQDFRSWLEVNLRVSLGAT